MKGANAIIAKIPAREWRGLTPEWAGGRLQIPLTCHICGETDHWSAAKMVGPQTAVPKIIQLGWGCDGKLTCPTCVTLRRHSKNKPDQVKTNSIKIVEASMSNIALVPAAKLIDDQKKNKRLVILALEDYYDENAKSYRPGKSDKVVADDLSLSIGFVANVREEFYGKMSEPKDIADFREKIAAVEKSINDLKTQFTGLCNRNDWKV